MTNVQTGKHMLMPWVRKSQQSPDKINIPKTLRHFESFIQTFFLFF